MGELGIIGLAGASSESLLPDAAPAAVRSAVSSAASSAMAASISSARVRTTAAAELPPAPTEGESVAVDSVAGVGGKCERAKAEEPDSEYVLALECGRAAADDDEDEALPSRECAVTASERLDAGMECCCPCVLAWPRLDMPASEDAKAGVMGDVIGLTNSSALRLLPGAPSDVRAASMSCETLA